MNFSWSPFPMERSTKTPQKFGENLEQNSGRKFEEFGKLSFCNFCEPKLFTTTGADESRRSTGSLQKGGVQKGGFGGCSPVPRTGTRIHSDVPRYQDPEQGYIRMFPRHQNLERGYIRRNHPFSKPPFCFLSSSTGKISTADNFPGNARELPEIITSTGAKFWWTFCSSVLHW